MFYNGLLYRSGIGNIQGLSSPEPVCIKLFETILKSLKYNQPLKNRWHYESI